MPVPLVLDTNAFMARGFQHWLRGYRGRKLLPAVAYAELGVHMRRRLTADHFDALLDRSGIEVEWLTADLAALAAELGIGRGDWVDRAADYLIGAHAIAAPRVLVTSNERDFDFLGDRVRSPEALMSSGRAHP